MPPSQRSSGSVLFTPPADEGMGMNQMGRDPMIKTMMISKKMDQLFQELVGMFPELTDPMAQVRQSLGQIITGYLSSQQGQGQGQGIPGYQPPGAQSQGAPNIVPPLPMQGGPEAGQQHGPGL